MSSFVETPNEPEGAPPLNAQMMTSITCVAGVAVALAVGSVVGFGWRMGASCAAGGLVATLNLWAFAYVGRGMLTAKRRLWGLLGGLKLLVLLGVFYLLLSSGMLAGLGVAAGYGALPLGVVIGDAMSRQTKSHP